MSGRHMALVALLLLVPAAFAPASTGNHEPVEMEMMTWPELHRAIHQQGKTTALVYNGGTEQHGPHAITGAHTFVGRETVKAIALQLRNAVAAPVLPYSPNDANPKLPGTIGVSPAAFKAMNRDVAEQLIVNGFTTVILMGDHFAGQKELGEVASELDRTYAPRGIRIFYCDDVYTKARNEFAVWLQRHGYPESGHAGLLDTSELLYVGGDNGWVRKNLIATALGDSMLPRSRWRDTSYKWVNNGIMGDARQSTAILGKIFFDLKVTDAVAQIRRFTKGSRAG